MSSKRRAMLLIISIIVIYLTFMLGRYSWSIQKPAYLSSSEETFWVGQAKKYMIEKGITEDHLKNVSVDNAIIVRFENDGDVNFVKAEVTFLKASGEFLRATH